MKKETFWAIIIAAIVLLFSNAYVLYGFLEPKDGLSYLGRRVINSQDTYTYVAFIEQARQGKYLFENLYTSEPQKASLLRPSYIFLGRVASFLDLSSIEIYHLGRVIFGILFCIVLYVFLGLFFKTPKKRLLAFAITLSASGLGFLFGGIISSSSDLWIPESNTFLSFQEAPHFILSQALMLLAFLFIFKGWVASSELKKKTRVILYFSISVISLLFLGFEHPYDLLLCSGVVVLAAAYFWITKKFDRKTLAMSTIAIVIACAIGLLYQFVETLRNPILSNWAAQSSSPSPINFIFGYGILTFLAVFGMEKYLSERKMPQILVVTWLTATCILLYSPVFFQRRLSEALHIPISILATEGLIVVALFFSSLVVQKIKKIVYQSFIVIVVILMLLGTITGVSLDLNTVGSDSLDSYYYYLLNDEVRAMEWLRYNASTNDVILSNWFYGNIIPGISGRKVFLGHKAQTKDFDGKISKVNKFLLNKNTEQAYKFLKDNHITFVYVGKNDSMLRYGFKPDAKPYLIKKFDEGNVRVYKVR